LPFSVLRRSDLSGRCQAPAIPRKRPRNMVSVAQFRNLRDRLKRLLRSDDQARRDAGLIRWPSTYYCCLQRSIPA
jgi:hypothetical protein